MLAAAVLLTLIAAFYTEESWRGKRAWENCKRAFEAKGIKVHQDADIPPPPVPDDQNVFAVPEMRQWFLGNGPSDLSARLGDIADISWAGDTNQPTTRVIVAEVAFSQPGSNSPAGFTVLTYGDPKAKAEVDKLIKDAVGPYFNDPWEIRLLVRRPEEIHPVKILLQCQTAPSAKELEQFLTNDFFPLDVEAHDETVRIESSSKTSYAVTTEVSGTAAELLARIAVLEPQFAVMRQAFQRPYVRILGADEKHLAVFGNLARVLGTQAKCHLILGQPDEALRDLTLSKDLCRLVEDPPGSRSGMLAMLIRATVTRIDIDVIADGLSRHAWTEPQLAALQDQLKNINFVSDTKQAMLAGPARVSYYYPTASAFNLGELYLGDYQIMGEKTNAWTLLKATVVGELVPRGWVYQNMVQLANAYVALGESSDSAGQIVYLKKADAAGILPKSHPSIFNYLARRSIPNYSHICRNTAKYQTQVHEALIACALERYRLAHNAYPETLDALVPQYLAQVPRDIIGGQPLHYRRTDDGKFLLYSVGWNETDDGGKPASDDDWVWDDSRR